MSDSPASAATPGRDLAVPAAADSVAKTCREMLALPVFANNYAIQMLVKLAADEKVPPRERMNCLRTLAQVQMKLLEAWAAVEAGRGAPAAASAVAQVEQTVRVEIVRGKDWRDAEVTLKPEPAAPPALNGTAEAVS